MDFLNNIERKLNFETECNKSQWLDSVQVVISKILVIRYEKIHMFVFDTQFLIVF